MSAELWNRVFSNFEDKIPKSDDWLDKYSKVLELSKDTAIVDLGCGFGNDTFYLYERGYHVTSCDFSYEALKIIERLIPNPDTRLFDILDGLPFNNGSAKIIIADLSLHYFTWEDTLRIVCDINRVLSKDGYLLCRVNSVRDNNYGAGQGILIEENYYNVNGQLKRFFDRSQLEKLFINWSIKHLEEYDMKRYNKNKIVWEISAQKI